MQVRIICAYCDFKWLKNVYTKQSLEDEQCPHCKDKNLIIRDLSEERVDFYKGDKPFPPKVEAIKPVPKEDPKVEEKEDNVMKDPFYTLYFGND